MEALDERPMVMRDRLLRAPRAQPPLWTALLIADLAADAPPAGMVWVTQHGAARRALLHDERSLGVPTTAQCGGWNLRRRSAVSQV